MLGAFGARRPRPLTRRRLTGLQADGKPKCTPCGSKRGLSPDNLLFYPPLERWPQGGVYGLWLRVLRPVTIRVGRLGCFGFPAGVYVYIGRATRGLAARVLRHALGSRHRHWHIDYLLASPHVRLERIRLASTDAHAECEISRQIMQRGKCIVPRFGASDCQNRCPTHLWRVE